MASSDGSQAAESALGADEEEIRAPDAEEQSGGEEDESAVESESESEPDARYAGPRSGPGAAAGGGQALRGPAPHPASLLGARVRFPRAKRSFSGGAAL